MEEHRQHKKTDYFLNFLCPTPADPIPSASTLFVRESFASLPSKFNVFHIKYHTHMFEELINVCVLKPLVYPQFINFSFKLKCKSVLDTPKS